MKRLSIIIPTYNMEQLLPQCLDSLVISPAAEALDVVVVNDGSRDSSLQIATNYAARYPEIIRVIDKPNGNYGSTINAALPTLRGEYVKILDADDTFDTQAVAPFVEYLAQVSGADMVVAPFTEISHQGERTVSYDLYHGKHFGYGVAYDAERVFEREVIPYFMMHSVAYRTALMQSIGYHQREGVSYTDLQWCFFPIFKVATIAFTDISLYRYNLTREGQSMDSTVQLRKIDELTTVVTDMAQMLDSYGSEVSVARYNFLAGVVMRRMQTVLRKYLLEMDDRTFATSNFEATLAAFMRYAPQPLRVYINGKLRVDILRRWQRRGSRYPRLIRRAILAVDSAMQRIYKALFG
ncbi:MAG: glycosyltransferase family 2 protein [Alistipes sp.]|nr:glycosyltransferase family 2 protein [Alistipes sp.]